MRWSLVWVAAAARSRGMRRGGVCLVELVCEGEGEEEENSWVSGLAQGRGWVKRGG